MNLHRLTTLSVALLVCAPAQAGQDNSAPSVDQIMAGVFANEENLQRAHERYDYVRDLRLQELNRDDSINGEFHARSEVSVDTVGNRTEKDLGSPTSSLKRIGVTREDLNDLRTLALFPFGSSDINRVDVSLRGRESVDGIPCYILDIKRRAPQTGERGFEGTIWVEQQGLQIIQSLGKVLASRNPGTENLFPEFLAKRALVEGYWFPVSVTVEDTLHFNSGDVRIRELVSFEHYRRSR